MLKLLPNPEDPSPAQNVTENTAITRGSGKWGHPDVPKTGWVFSAEIDHGEVSQVCQMCEYMHIRYEHIMVHEDWPEPLGCGCICAGHMSNDMPGATERQHRMERTALNAKAKALREARQAEQQAQHTECRTQKPRITEHHVINGLKGWYTAHSGNPILWSGDWRAVVFRGKKSRKWGYMLCFGDAEPIWGKVYFGDVEIAKTAARTALINKVMEKSR